MVKAGVSRLFLHSMQKKAARELVWLPFAQHYWDMKKTERNVLHFVPLIEYCKKIAGAVLPKKSNILFCIECKSIFALNANLHPMQISARTTKIGNLSYSG